MHQLEFTSATVGETHEDEGTVRTDDDGNLVFETSHENRPNYRIIGDSVTLISANTGVEIPDFGEHPVLSGYCQIHDVDFDSLTGYDHCPQCRMEDDIRAQEMEMMTRRPPRSVDDPAPHGSYDAW